MKFVCIFIGLNKPVFSRTSSLTYFYCHLFFSYVIKFDKCHLTAVMHAHLNIISDSLLVEYAKYSSRKFTCIIWFFNSPRKYYHFRNEKNKFLRHCVTKVINDRSRIYTQVCFQRSWFSSNCLRCSASIRFKCFCGGIVYMRLRWTVRENLICEVSQCSTVFCFSFHFLLYYEFKISWLNTFTVEPIICMSRCQMTLKPWWYVHACPTLWDIAVAEAGWDMLKQL